MNKKGLSMRKKTIPPTAFEEWDWAKSFSENCIDNLVLATHQVMQVLQNDPSPYEKQTAEFVYDAVYNTLYCDLYTRINSIFAGFTTVVLEDARSLGPNEKYQNFEATLIQYINSLMHSITSSVLRDMPCSTNCIGETIDMCIAESIFQITKVPDMVLPMINIYMLPCNPDVYTKMVSTLDSALSTIINLLPIVLVQFMKTASTLITPGTNLPAVNGQVPTLAQVFTVGALDSNNDNNEEW